jgi:DNA invertase Pin-like site-specific DNA recombinase
MSHAAEAVGSGISPDIVPVAIYTRVSTLHQIGGRFTSCESQEAICREYILRNAQLGWQEVACHSDPAYSGGSMKRPGMEALKHQIERGEVKVVVLFMLERVLRSTDEWASFRRFLEEHQCRLESPTGDISESEPEGRLKNNIVMSVAEYARLSTAKKVRIKMHEQAKRGIWNGGMVPYGYAYDRNTQSLLPHPEESVVVRQIYEAAAKLTSLERIANQLNDAGLRTKMRTVRRRDGSSQPVGAKRFRGDRLRFMIANPVYRGAVRFGGNEYPAQHVPLVEVELWEKANAAVEKMVRPVQEFRLEQDKHFHLLKGLLRCGCCGRAMVPHACGNKDRTGKPYRYYDCSHLVKERQDSPCPVRRIAAGAIEQAVVRFLSDVGKHQDIIAAAVGNSRSRRQDRRAELKTGIAELDRNLADTNKGIRNCVEAIASGGKRIADELGEQVNVLKDRKQSQVVERERLAQELTFCDGAILDERRVCKSVEHFGKILQGLSQDEQKTLVSLFIERIEVRPVVAASPSDLVGPGFRRFELKFKLNVPRLVESMEDRMIVETKSSRPALRGLVLSAEVAVGQQGRARQAAVLAPFECANAKLTVTPPAPPPAEVHHPLIRALAWQKKLTENPKLSLRGLARREGEVAPSITRHFKLLKLAPEIQAYVRKLHDPKAIYFFSLRRLMPLAAMEPAKQLARFAEWRAEFEQRDKGTAAGHQALEVAPAAAARAGKMKFRV